MTPKVEIQLDEMLPGVDTNFQASVSVSTPPGGEPPDVEIQTAVFKVYNSYNQLITTDAGTITGMIVNIPVPGTLFQEYQDNCRLEITITTSTGEKGTHNHYYDVVHSPWVCNVTTNDLQTPYPDIQDYLWNGESDFSKQIEFASNQVKGKVKALGRRSLLIIDNQIQELIFHKALEIIFQGFPQKGGGLWMDMAEKEGKNFKEKWNDTTFRYYESTQEIPGGYGVTTVPCVR